MNEELLMQALQNGQITPSEYELIMNSAQFKQMDTNGLLGGPMIQMGQSPVAMPQAPEPTMSMRPMPCADPSPMQMSPMPQVGNRGQDTPNERDYLEQFANSQNQIAENYGLGSRGVDTPSERDLSLIHI